MGEGDRRRALEYREDDLMVREISIAKAKAEGAAKYKMVLKIGDWYLVRHLGMRHDMRDPYSYAHGPCKDCSPSWCPYGYTFGHRDPESSHKCPICGETVPKALRTGHKLLIHGRKRDGE